MATPTHASAFADGAEYEAILGLAHKYYLRVKARVLARLVQRHHPAATRFVDFGCGSGEMAEALVGSDWKVSGLDLSPGMIRYANAKSLPNARFFVADAAKTDLPGDSFDVAFATALFHHLPPAARVPVLAEMRRVVRPGGLVIVFEHNPANPVTVRVVKTCPVDKDAILVHPKEFNRIFAKARLVPVEQHYLLFFPRALGFLARLEGLLRWCPVGGQYVVVARKPTKPGSARSLLREPRGRLHL